MDKAPTLPQPTRQDIADFRRVNLGAGYRLPMPVPTEVIDTNRIKLGAGYRLPANRATD